MNGAYRGIRSLEMGTCSSARGSFIKCAFTADECDPDQRFDAHVQDVAIMKKCSPNETRIGRCLEENKCALRSIDCEFNQDPTNYLPPGDSNQSCTIQGDKFMDWDVDNDDRDFTQFGSCRNAETGQYFCIYDPDDCNESSSEVYASPAETLVAGVRCTCRDVHVWGCRTARHTFCAVNEFSFRDLTSCMPSSPLEQREERKKSDSDHLDCRLCRKLEKYVTSAPIFSSAPTHPRSTNSPTPNPTLKSTIDLNLQLPVDQFSEGSGGGGAGNANVSSSLIGGSVSAAVAFIFVCVGLMITGRKCS